MKKNKQQSKYRFPKIEEKVLKEYHRQFMEDSKKIMTDIGPTNAVELVHRNR